MWLRHIWHHIWSLRQWSIWLLLKFILQELSLIFFPKLLILFTFLRKHFFGGRFLLFWRNFFFLRFWRNFFGQNIFFFFGQNFLLFGETSFWQTSFGKKSFGELHLAKLHLAFHGFARFYPGYDSGIDFFKRLDRPTHKHTLAQLYHRYILFQQEYTKHI